MLQRCSVLFEFAVWWVLPEGRDILIRALLLAVIGLICCLHVVDFIHGHFSGRESPSLLVLGGAEGRQLRAELQISRADLVSIGRHPWDER